MIFIIIVLVFHVVTFCSPGVLEILAAAPSHAGRYTCSARNPIGVAHKHVTLTVQGKGGGGIPPLWVSG